MTQRFLFRGDGGIPLAVVKRMLDGEVLYRDLKVFWMPGTFYLLFGVMKVFGSTLFSVRLLILVCFASLFILLYLISLKLLCSSCKALASLLLFVLLLSPLSFYYNHNWLGLIPAGLVVLFLMSCGSNRRSFKTWLMAGLLTGVAASINQWESVALYLAVSVLITISLRGAWRRKFKWWIQYSAGTAIIPFLWLVYFGSRGLLTDFFEAALLFPFRHYHQGNMQQFPSLLWFILTAFYLVWLKQMIGKSQQFDWSLRVVSVFGLAFHLFSFVNVNRGHVLFGLLFAAPLIVYFLTTFPQKAVDSSRFNRFSLRSRHISQMVGSGFLVSFLLADFIVHALPHFRYQIAYTNHAVKTDRGLLYTDKYYGRNIEEVLTFLNQECEDGEYVYIGPYVPYLYYISSVRNPTRYAHLGPEHYTDEIFDEVISDLEKKEVEKVVFLPSETVFRDGGDDLLTQYIMDNFEPLKVFDLPFQPSRLQDPPDAIWVREN